MEIIELFDILEVIKAIFLDLQLSTYIGAGVVIGGASFTFERAVKAGK